MAFEPIGSQLGSKPQMPSPLRTRGFQVAKYCFLIQIVIGSMLWLAAYLVPDPDQDLNALLTLGWLASGLANLLMWLGLAAPWLYNWLRGRNDRRDQFLILGQLSELLKLGVPVPEALECLAAHQGSGWRTAYSQGSQCLQLMAGSTAQGDSLGQAMQRVGYFPSHWAPLLEAAEKRGLLIAVLDHLEGGRNCGSWFTVWFALRLIFLWFVAVPIGVFLVTYILPTFVVLFEGMSIRLPLVTQVLIQLGRSTRSPLGVVVMTGLPLAVVAGAFMAYLRPAFATRVWSLLCRIPPMSRVVPLEDQAAVAATLASCLHLELTQPEALQVAALAPCHPAYRVALAQDSPSISQTMEQNPRLFAAPLRWLAARGQQQGNLEEALGLAGEYLTEQAEETRLRWSVWLDSGAAMLFGLIALFIVVGTMAPLCQITAAMLEQLVMP